MRPARAAVRAFAILSLFLPSARAASRAEDLAGKLDAYLNQAAAVNHFSGSVLVARQDKVLLSKGYGMANLEHGVPNTPSTKFRLGSLTKQFTALAVLMLQEQGRLSVREPICKYVPACPQAWKEITIHHLLTHTSGIPNFTSFPDYVATMRLPTDPARTIARFKNKPLEFQPGERFNYSNSGYILLGFIIEKVSGQCYAEFLRAHIFDPLGMTSTGYDDASAILAQRAAGYARTADTWKNAAFIDMSIPFAAGGLYSTVEDLRRWDQALSTEKLVSKKTLAQIFTPFKGNYAYGWAVGRQFERKWVGHAGGINGFATDIARYPDDHVCVIVLSNLETAPASGIGRTLSAIVFGAPYSLPKERKAIPIAAETLAAYAGRYQLAPSFILTITKEGEGLKAQATGQGKIDLFAASEREFFAKAIDAQIRFEKDAKGRVTQLILHQNGKDVPAKKIP